jgi:hypothetical protein
MGEGGEYWREGEREFIFKGKFRYVTMPALNIFC